MAVERVTFTKPAAQRISRVVRIVEAGDRDTSSGVVSPRLESGGNRQAIRLCSWTSTWAVDTVSVIRFSPATSVTATATNEFLGVGPGYGWAYRHGTAGYQLIGAKLSLQPNYSSTEVQLFGHDASAVAHWYSITTCSTASS